MINQVGEKNGNFRQIEVTDNNEVKIFAIHEKSEDEPKTEIRKEKKYNHICLINLRPSTGNELDNLVEGITDKERDIFSMKTCQKICSVNSETVVNYYTALDETFVKMTDKKGMQRIFDEMGRIIAFSDASETLKVEFSGTGPFIVKTDNITGKSRRYTLEGSLIG